MSATYMNNTAYASETNGCFVPQSKSVVRPKFQIANKKVAKKLHTVVT